MLLLTKKATALFLLSSACLVRAEDSFWIKDPNDGSYYLIVGNRSSDQVSNDGVEQEDGAATQIDDTSTPGGSTSGTRECGPCSFGDAAASPFSSSSMGTCGPMTDAAALPQDLLDRKMPAKNDTSEMPMPVPVAAPTLMPTTSYDAPAVAAPYAAAAAPSQAPFMLNVVNKATRCANGYSLDSCCCGGRMSSQTTDTSVVEESANPLNQVMGQVSQAMGGKTSNSGKEQQPENGDDSKPGLGEPLMQNLLGAKQQHDEQEAAEDDQGMVTGDVAAEDPTLDNLHEAHKHHKKHDKKKKKKHPDPKKMKKNHPPKGLKGPKGPKDGEFFEGPPDGEVFKGGEDVDMTRQMLSHARKSGGGERKMGMAFKGE